MTIKFEKEMELSGRTWYKVLINGTTEFASEDSEKAKEYYLNVIQRAKDGYPKKETIEEITITTKP